LTLLSEKQLLGGAEITSWFVPFGAYVEGGLSSNMFKEDEAHSFPTTSTISLIYDKFGLNHIFMIPTFELVAHDLIASTWARDDANHIAQENWLKKNLFNVLYGNMPLWRLDSKIWKEKKDIFVRSYKRISEWTKQIAFDEMTSHKWLTAEGDIQMTEWSSGRYVVVNFGQNSALMKDGSILKPMSFKTFSNALEIENINHE